MNSNTLPLIHDFLENKEVNILFLSILKALWESTNTLSLELSILD